MNFFTQASLGRVLRRHFGTVEFSRICPMRVNGTTFYVSLVARCRKAGTAT